MSRRSLVSQRKQLVAMRVPRPCAVGVEVPQLDVQKHSTQVPQRSRKEVSGVTRQGLVDGTASQHRPPHVIYAARRVVDFKL